MRNLLRFISLGVLCLILQPLAVRAAASLELYGTFHAMGVIVTIAPTDDPDEDAIATVEYGTGSDSYRAGFPLSRVSDTRFVGSLFWLEPATTYDVRVTFSDPDGDPLAGVVVGSTGATRAEITIPPPAHSYYVTPNGSGTACTLASPCSLVYGLSRVEAGQEVVLRGGVYYRGELGLFRSGTAGAIDWEDIAIGPGPAEGQDYIYVGDTGDNGRSRSSVTVYRVAEPGVSATQDPLTVNLAGVDALPMQYPGPEVYDAETLLVDPASGDIFLVTRDREGQGVARVFRNPAPHAPGVMVTLELVATISLPQVVKGGDVSPAGDAVLLRLPSGYYWPRAAGTNLWEAFSVPACTVPLAAEPQGEALSFAADGLGYYTLSEGIFQPVYFYEKR